jgi:serine/threonine protein kinase
MHDIVEGMAYLHSKFKKDGSAKPVLFHQDLKSDNVLLGIERGDLRAKISDFGYSSKSSEFTIMFKL